MVCPAPRPPSPPTEHPGVFLVVHHHNDYRGVGGLQLHCVWIFVPCSPHPLASRPPSSPFVDPPATRDVASHTHHHIACTQSCMQSSATCDCQTHPTALAPQPTPSLYTHIHIHTHLSMTTSLYWFLSCVGNWVGCCQVWGRGAHYHHGSLHRWGDQSNGYNGTWGSLVLARAHSVHWWSHLGARCSMPVWGIGQSPLSFPLH